MEKDSIYAPKEAIEGNVIPIDSEIDNFRQYLSYNDRIVFSAAFGDGKSYFLDNFFESCKGDICCIKIYPVNYSVEDNKDIFELINRDVLLQLLGNDMIENENLIDDAIVLQTELFGGGGGLVMDILKSVIIGKLKSANF